MAGLIAQADIEEVKSRVNIADVIGERVALKSAGVGSLKGLCPFHDERSPSFHVRPQVGFYHCFGCGESGDVYTFLRQMDHVSFTEAVEILAGRVGYSLHYEEGGAAPETSGRSRLYAANAAAAEYFRGQLSSSEAAIGRKFLGERGFDAGAAARFGVGYAPKGWSHLLDALTAKGFSKEELTIAGLVSQGQRGIYDRFRGRLVWPIRDLTGQVLGFGARRLHDDDNGPKYLNTPETPIYKKAQVLYGLDLAKRDISRSHSVVVVEGYTDVMACHLAGITTAIATCGTAFGTDHITVLRRVMGDDNSSGEVIFTFDPDEAGQKAALRAFGDEKRFAAQTYVAIAPEGLDPCDLRLKRGDGAVRSLIDAKSPMFEFAIDRRLEGFDLATVEGRAGALGAAAPIVADIRDPSLRPGYVRVLARRIGLELGEVRAAVERAARRGNDAAKNPRKMTTPQNGAAGVDGAPNTNDAPAIRVSVRDLPRTAETALERDTLMGALQYGHRMDADLFRRAMAVDFHTPGLDAVRQSVAAAPDPQRAGWAVDAVSRVREPYRTLAAELLTSDFPARDDEHAVASANDLARRVLMRALDREKSELVRQMKQFPGDSIESRKAQIRAREIDIERAQVRGEQ
ncbi:DNA primase [Microbacterium halimionae]|uniref:DNA primase n=1 Tax=Microbacterium halimionae TaxID=1526413 RepID=A0A7W3JNC3_9MICO|nr:DNA primase [Microbacterium halimionae]MBA8816037.1 DNA primase [Microbacterium halimionae]NII96239.1 DNA primase [Microbacterium halimionae]